MKIIKTDKLKSLLANRKNFLVVLEGAVRSGKTLNSNAAFLFYMMESEENVFILSGKSVGSLARNVIYGDTGLLALSGEDGDYRIDNTGNRIFELNTEKGRKVAYCFGASDERAFQTLRGLTAGGWYADEASLYPRSFVEEAFSRTIASKDRRHIWTLNPQQPRHWIYKDYIDKFEREKLHGFYYQHYTLVDNPILTTERIEEIKKQKTGVFYERDILGLRVVAEGAIYDVGKVKTEGKFLAAKYQGRPIVGIDYGTSNATCFLLGYVYQDTIYVTSEYYYDSKREGVSKSDYEYAKDFQKWLDDCGAGKDFPLVFIDPAAASFKIALRDIGFMVNDANNAVVDGIRLVNSLIDEGRLLISSDCTNLLEEMSSYMWQNSQISDKPIKQFDHAVDALRYLCVSANEKIMRADPYKNLFL